MGSLSVDSARLFLDRLKISEDFSRNQIEVKVIKRFHQPITFDNFIYEGLIKNQICIFSPWITKGWNALDSWTKPTSERNGQGLFEPNFDAILTSCKDSATVPVSTICTAKECQEKDTWKLKDYANYWNSEKRKGGKAYYLKDWHYWIMATLKKGKYTQLPFTSLVIG